MSEMIERVARAINNAIDPTSDDPIGVTFHHSNFVEAETMDEQLEQVMSICRSAARAAIEAMREPTFDPENVSYHEGMTRADWWRTMIDAALQERV